MITPRIIGSRDFLGESLDEPDEPDELEDVGSDVLPASVVFVLVEGGGVAVLEIVIFVSELTPLVLDDVDVPPVVVDEDVGVLDVSLVVEEVCCELTTAVLDVVCVACVVCVVCWVVVLVVVEVEVLACKVKFGVSASNVPPLTAPRKYPPGEALNLNEFDPEL